MQTRCSLAWRAPVGGGARSLDDCVLFSLRLGSYIPSGLASQSSRAASFPPFSSSCSFSEPATAAGAAAASVLSPASSPSSASTGGAQFSLSPSRDDGRPPRRSVWSSLLVSRPSLLPFSRRPPRDSLPRASAFSSVARQRLLAQSLTEAPRPARQRQRAASGTRGDVERGKQTTAQPAAHAEAPRNPRPQIGDALSDSETQRGELGCSGRGEMTAEMWRSRAEGEAEEFVEDAREDSGESRGGRGDRAAEAEDQRGVLNSHHSPRRSGGGQREETPKRLQFDLERPFTQREKLRVRAQMREALDTADAPESGRGPVVSLSSHSACLTPSHAELEARQRSGQHLRDAREAESALRDSLDAYLARVSRKEGEGHAGSLSGGLSSSAVPACRERRAVPLRGSRIRAPPQPLPLPDLLRLLSFLSSQRSHLSRCSPAGLLADIEPHPLLHLLARSLHREKGRLPPDALAASLEFLLALSEQTAEVPGASAASTRTWPLLKSLTDLFLAPGFFASRLLASLEETLSLLLRVAVHPAGLLSGDVERAARHRSLWEQICEFLFSQRGSRLSEAEVLALLRTLSLLAEGSAVASLSARGAGGEAAVGLLGSLALEGEALVAACFAGNDLDTALLSRALERHLVPDWLYAASPHTLVVLLLLLTRLGCLSPRVFSEIAEVLLLGAPFLGDACLLPLLHTLLVCRQHFDLRLAQEMRGHSEVAARRFRDNAPDAEGLAEDALGAEEEDASHPLYEARVKRLLQALRYRVQCRFGQVPFSTSVDELGALLSVYKPNEHLRRVFLDRCVASPDLLMHLTPARFLIATKILARLGVSHGSQARFAFARALPRQLPHMQLEAFLELTRAGAGGGVGALETMRAAISAEKKAREALVQTFRRLAFDACDAILLAEGGCGGAERRVLGSPTAAQLPARAAEQDCGRLEAGLRSAPGAFRLSAEGDAAQGVPPRVSHSPGVSAAASSSAASPPRAPACFPHARSAWPRTLLALIRSWTALGLSKRDEPPLPLILFLVALQGADRRALLRRQQVPTPGRPLALDFPPEAPGAHVLPSVSASSSCPAVSPAELSPSASLSLCASAAGALGRESAAAAWRGLSMPRASGVSLVHALSMPDLLLLVSTSRAAGLLLAPALAAAVLHRLRRSGGLISPDGAAEILYTLSLQQLVRHGLAEEAAQRPARRQTPRDKVRALEARRLYHPDHPGAEAKAETEKETDREEEEEEEEENPMVYGALFESISSALWDELVEQPATADLVKIFWAIVAGEQWKWLRRLGAPIVDFCAAHFSEIQGNPQAQRLFFQALCHVRTQWPSLAGEYFLLLDRTPAVSPSLLPPASNSLFLPAPAAALCQQTPPPESLLLASLPEPSGRAFFSPSPSSLDERSSAPPVAQRAGAAVGAEARALAPFPRLAVAKGVLSLAPTSHATETCRRGWWLGRSVEGDACSEFDLASRQLQTDEGILKTALKGSVLTELQLTWRAGQKTKLTSGSAAHERLGAVLRRLSIAPFFQQTLDIDTRAEALGLAGLSLPPRRRGASLASPASLALLSAHANGGFLSPCPAEEEYSLTWGNPVWRVGVLVLPAGASGEWLRAELACRPSVSTLLRAERDRLGLARKDGGGDAVGGDAAARDGEGLRRRDRRRRREEDEAQARAAGERERVILDELIRRDGRASGAAQEAPREGTRLTAKSAMHIKFLQDVRDWRIVVLQQEKVKERLKHENEDWLARRLELGRDIFPLPSSVSSFLREYVSSAHSPVTPVAKNAGCVSAAPVCAHEVRSCSLPHASSLSSSLSLSGLEAQGRACEDAVLPSSTLSEGMSNDAEKERISFALIPEGKREGRRETLEVLSLPEGEGRLRGRRGRRTNSARLDIERSLVGEAERLQRVEHFREIRDAAFVQMQKELLFLFSLDD